MLHVELATTKHRIIYGLDFKHFNYKKINLIPKEKKQFKTLISLFINLKMYFHDLIVSVA